MFYLERVYTLNEKAFTWYKYINQIKSYDLNEKEKKPRTKATEE